MRDSLYRQLVWDYQLSPQDFEAILHGQKTIGSLNQVWAIQRVLEHANYYQALSLVPLETLRRHWPTLKTRLFDSTLRHGYEFLLQKYALSSSR